MSDLILKIRLLFIRLINECKNWKVEILDKDLDEQICCHGGGSNPENYCDCRGMTLRGEIELHMKIK